MKNPIHKEMIEAFHTWYEKEKGIKFIWDAKQTKQIDFIYDKLYQACNDNDGPVHHRLVSMLFSKMLENLQKADKWIYENVSPALISSKFNELIAKLRALNTGHKNYDNLKKDLINKMFSTKNEQSC
jgi:hypothetical protein